MTKRLETIYSLINPGTGVADIGTDHGYIPVQLALDGYPGNIIASDINEQPLESAKKNAKLSGAYGRIKFITSDGLSEINPAEIDTIILAGMGGDLICRILDRAPWICDGAFRLILQPMTKAEVLRNWLSCNGFSVIADIPVKDMGKLYSVICAEYTGNTSLLSDSELYTGEYSLIRSSEYFTELIDMNISRILKITIGLRMTGAEQYLLNFYDSILNGLTNMKDGSF